MVRESAPTSGKAWWFKSGFDILDDAKVERTESGQYKIFLDGNSQPHMAVIMQVGVHVRMGQGGIWSSVSQTTQTANTKPPTGGAKPGEGGTSSQTSQGAARKPAPPPPPPPPQGGVSKGTERSEEIIVKPPPHQFVPAQAPTQAPPTQVPTHPPPSYLSQRNYPLDKLRAVLGNDLKYICAHLNILLSNAALAKTYLPIKEEDIFGKLEDGVLLCAMANVLKRDIVDEKALHLPPCLPILTAQTINVGLVSLSTLGVFIGDIDAELVYLEGSLHLIVIIVQWLRLATVGRMNLVDNPQLVNILENKGDQAEINAMLSMPPEEVLIRWVNYQLKKPHGESQTGSKEKNATLLEYARLLDAVAPAAKKASMTSVEAITREKTIAKQAEMVVKNADALGIKDAIAPEHIIDDDKEANDSGRSTRCRILRSVFLARVFLLYPNIQTAQNPSANKKADEASRTRIQNKKNNEGGIEEMLMMWLLSFGISTPVISLDIELLQSGIILLQVLDNMYPGCVNWTNVNAAYAEKSPKRKLYWCANCDLVMQIVARHKMKVNCSGSDIRAGDKKKILDLVLVMMQRHIQLLRKTSLGSGTTEIDDKDLIVWFNEEMKTHGSDFRINDINDVTLRNTNAIGFFGERILAEYSLCRFRLVIERERHDTGIPMYFEAVKPVPAGELETFSRSAILLLRQGGVHVYSSKLGPGVDVLVYRYILLQLNAIAIKWKETGIMTKGQIRRNKYMWIGPDMRIYTEQIADNITSSPKTPKRGPSHARRHKGKRRRKNRRNKPKSRSTTPNQETSATGKTAAQTKGQETSAAGKTVTVTQTKGQETSATSKTVTVTQTKGQETSAAGKTVTQTKGQETAATSMTTAQAKGQETSATSKTVTQTKGQETSAAGKTAAQTKGQETSATSKTAAQTVGTTVGSKATYSQVTSSTSKTLQTSKTVTSKTTTIQQNVTYTQQSSTSTQQTSTSTQQTSTSTQKTGTSTQQTSTSTQKTGTSTQQTGTSTQQTGTSTQQTGTSTQQTGTTGQRKLSTIIETPEPSGTFKTNDDKQDDSSQDDESEEFPYDGHDTIPEHAYSLTATSDNLSADICCICTHLNLQLARIDFAKAYLPLTEKNLFTKLEDGVLLCAMANALRPGAVDTKTIALPPCAPIQRTNNINLGLMSLSIYGVSIGDIDPDVVYHYGAAHLLDVVLQWLLLITLDMLNLKSMPQLAYVLENWFYPDEMVNIQLMHRDYVLRLWVNYQLKNAGTELVMNENRNKKDGILLYAYLLSTVAPLEKKISMTPIDAIIGAKDQKQQVEMVVKNAEALGLKDMIAQGVFTDSQDYFKSWRSMILRSAFLAQTCLLYPNISIPERKYTDLFTSPGDLIRPVKEGSIEETLMMWLNSFLLCTQIVCMGTDLRNGITLLQVLDAMYPGCVDWSKVTTEDEKMPKRKFNWTENCRLALGIATQRDIKVNCSSADIVSGETTKICTVVYAMMQKHIQILRQTTLGGEAKEISDKELVSWFNDQMKEYKGNFQIHDIVTDLSLKSCNAIGFLGERILFYNRFCRHCGFQNTEEIIGASNSLTESKSSSSDVDQNSEIEDPDSMSNLKSISKAVEHNSGRSMDVDDQNSEIMKADSAYYLKSSSNTADNTTSIDDPDSVFNLKSSSNSADHIAANVDPDSVSKLKSIANVVDQNSDAEDPDTVSYLKSSSNVVDQITDIDELESSNAVKPIWQFESIKSGRGEELNTFSRTTIALLRQGGVQVYSSKLGPDVDLLVYRSILLQLNTIASKD